MVSRARTALAVPGIPMQPSTFLANAGSGVNPTAAQAARTAATAISVWCGGGHLVDPHLPDGARPLDPGQLQAQRGPLFGGRK